VPALFLGFICGVAVVLGVGLIVSDNRDRRRVAESNRRVWALMAAEQARLPEAEFVQLRSHVISIMGLNDAKTPPDEGMAAALDLLEHRRRIGQ
jgi:hypothetical protein